MKSSFILGVLALFVPSVVAFVSQNSLARAPTSSVQPLHLFDASAGADILTTAANNIWLATIDGDIDAIPTNEFGTVFAGGIVVMFGGVLSALVVGFILDRGDLYATVAAESYLQGADDEEFWKGLSDEEKKKTQEVLEKIRQSKEGEASAAVATTTVEHAATESPTLMEQPKAPETKSAKPADMFSDYE